jgi:hypothetical protein
LDTTSPAIFISLLLFLDGILFGIATRKALVSTLLVVVGLLLAGFIGLGIPFFTINDFENHLVRFVSAQAANFPGVFVAFPTAWIIGFLVGLFLSSKLF